MSFDFSELPTKTDFTNANPDPTDSPPTEQEIYDKRKTRVQNRIVRFFSRTNGGNLTDLKLSIDFLTSGDKTALQSAIESKGFSCVETNGIMTIN